ncbi:MAG: hypothetical protein KJ749_09030, partial [Planctomycetes bacterium]|nr:hypothetical protein [Planctomycetota bacterium]
MTAHRSQLTLLQKAFALSSWFLAGALFLTIGWFALEPDDPLGAVSLLGRDGGLIMLVQAAALAGVAAAMATVIIGRHLADVGTFAAALGLAAVSLRGGNAGVLLLSYSDAADSVDRWLAVRLALETVGWFAVILVAIGVSAVVMSWCNPRPEGSSANPVSTRDIAAATMAGYDAPDIGPRFFQSTWDTSTPLTEGLKHTGIAAAV